ncbi:unnamed protein product [Mytilus edulis]|uniref:Reverse transcriptase domain-containing protein n=1 Tax=Mytilus edulis TaxID=6550 RepID=A0A8S3UD59_MYTED|nr:unnamed protein product [Mytilus edulis]
MMVLLVSHNCNGIRNIDKFKKYVSIMSEKNVDFMLFQETFWDDQLVQNVKHLYNGDIYHSDGTNNRQGVAILVKSNLCANVKQIYKDNNGRFLHLQFEYDDSIYNIMNVYAPNIVNEKADFFDFLNDYMKLFENTIIAGDWNTSLSGKDRCSRTVHKNDVSVKKLNDIMLNHNVYDIWRFRNPDKLVFSRKMVYNGELKQSRIDYFLLNRNLTFFVQSVYHFDTTISDHCFVEMKMNFEKIERGPGLWILNNTFLKNEEYISKIRNIIEEEKQSTLFNSEFLIWWDNLKYKIKKFSQVFGKRIQKEKNAEYFLLQNKLKRISERIALGEVIDVAQYENLKLDLSVYEEQKCKGAILRSKAFWATESDKCTKYFLQMEKQKQESHCIKELLNENNESVTNTEGILDTQYDFYNKLYSSVKTDDEVMKEFLKNVNTKINQEDVDLCDNDITVKEIEFALQKMARNKSPGSDGLTVEFYCTFFSSLKDILLKLFEEIEKYSKLSRSMRCGIISLIFKKKGDKRFLKNYRPISLLQVDYKILAKVMANRFKQVLCKIVSKCQSCCIPGRDIADTIANIRDVLDLIESEELEGYLLKMDQEKAFDKVGHTYLREVLKKYGFGDRFVNWVGIFYTDIQSSVKSNGFLTKYFKIKNGIRQGCPISALLYVLSAEPLQCAIRNNLNIEGINIPNCDEKAVIFQHADDTTLTLCNKESINETLNIFEIYGKASGSKINMSKSEIMCIGKAKINVSEIQQIGLKYSVDCIQILGVYVGKNKLFCDDLNWKDKISKIKMLVNLWKQRRLTLSGRATVISSLLMSRLWYTIAVCSIPDWALQSIKKICLDFLWNNGSHLIKYRTIIGAKTDGGLKYPDIYLKLLAFRLKFLTRFLDKDFHAIWKYTMTYFLNKIHNTNLGVHCLFLLLQKKDCTNIPVFYREIIDAWQYFKPYVDIDIRSVDIFNQPIFLNESIKVNGKCILWKQFLLAGITKLKHVAYEVVPGFLPFNAIYEMIENVDDNVDCNKLRQQYNSLLECIPNEWKKVILNETKPVNCDEVPLFIVNYNNKTKDFVCCKTKDFYGILVDKCYIEPDAHQYWLESFNVQYVPFKFVWTSVHCYWKSPDCVQLDFKIVHNRIFTNLKLKRIKLSDSDICDSCKSEVEDLFHLFLKCHDLDVFHSYMFSFLCELLEKCKIDVLVNQGYRQMFLLGMTSTYTDVNTYFVNFVLSVARLCVFKRRQMIKNDVKKIDLTRFFRYTLKHYISYFHVYCKMVNKMNTFERNFLKNNCKIIEIDGVLIFNF